MLIVLEATKLHKVFRAIGFLLDKNILCLTLLWYYRERYDSGKGLFRFQCGKFIEYGEKVGIKIEVLRFSWAWFKKDSGLIRA